MKSEKNVEKQIIEILNSYAKAYANKDLDSMLELFLDDPDIVAIGTGQDEWVYGFGELKEGFKRDIAQSENINVEFDNISVSNVENAAWASSYMNMNAKVSGEEIILRGRLTTVFKKVEDNWYIVQLHYSLPVEAQKDGHSFPERI